ncbi:hypothetical protein J3R30DRAFT_3511592, partial [Lentinula aciculospora]
MLYLCKLSLYKALRFILLLKYVTYILLPLCNYFTKISDVKHLLIIFSHPYQIHTIPFISFPLFFTYKLTHLGMALLCDP